MGNSVSGSTGHANIFKLFSAPGVVQLPAQQRALAAKPVLGC
jgi:hypothetical protein